jgi:hypothetical protein
MKNPFQQLDALQPGPAHCFEEVVSTILRWTIPDVKRVRVYHGDGGVDSFTGEWGSNGELHVYQVKYFVDQWKASQKQQIRNSYRTARDSTSFRLKKWTLIVPTDLTAEDWGWFDPWKAGQAHEIDLLNGSALTDLLRAPQCADARQMLKNWGVVGLPHEPVITAWVRLITNPPRFALQSNVWIENTGDRSLRSLRLRIAHSETNTVAVPADPEWWRIVRNFKLPR